MGILDVPSVNRPTLGDRFRAAALRGNSVHQRPWNATQLFSNGSTQQQGDVIRTTSGSNYVSTGTGAVSSTEPSHVNALAITNGVVPLTHLGPTLGDSVDTPGAPTVTFTGSASVPSGLQVIYPALNQSLFSYRGGTPSVYATNYLTLHNWRTDGTTLSQGASAVSFDVPGPRLAIQNLSASAGIGIRINGIPLRLGQLLAQQAGSYWVDITFNDGNTKHRVDVEFSRTSSTLMGIAVSPGCVVSPAVDEDSLSGAFIGDSYQDGSALGPFIPGGQLAQLLFRRLGISQYRAFAKGGTGIINKGVGNAFLNYQERLPQVLASPWNVLVVQGSTNEAGMLQATIQAAANSFLDQVQTARSDLIVLWLGPVPLNPANVGGISNADAAIAAACTGRANVFYVSPFQEAWMTLADTGITYIQNIISSDNQHPSDKGVRYLVTRFADRIINDVYPRIR